MMIMRDASIQCVSLLRAKPRSSVSMFVSFLVVKISENQRELISLLFTLSSDLVFLKQQLNMSALDG